jgi:uncharacterized protein YjbI with pentapeptide repeats
MMSWLQDHGWVIGVILAAALALTGLAWWAARRRPPATLVPGAAARRQVDLSFAAAVLVTLVVGLTAVLWLLEQADQVPAGKDRATLRADAVKTGATIALGTGGAAYLLLAYRRQRLDEVDTRERRITELYTKAVEQLGHEKAPVRLGALYSLERLAQNNPEHRQTVVDVFCAYLRMPYTLPARSEPSAQQVGEAALPADARDRAPHPVPGRDPTQEELQVRQTAQRILAAHLRLPTGTFSAAAQRRRPSPRRAFWPGISLDLTGAALVDFNLAQASVIQARFDGATFQGVAGFNGATFQGDTWFDEATFQGDTQFDEATFQGDTRFDRATFQGRTRFDEATFQGPTRFIKATFQGGVMFDGATFEGRTAWFEMATFQSGAWFRMATFQGEAGFPRATFQGDTWFEMATFQGDARFDEATFQGDDVVFNMATFQGDAWFTGVTFQSDAWFTRVTFQSDALFIEAPTFEGGAWFGEARFQGDARFDEATSTSGNGVERAAGTQVLHLDDPDLNERRVWPDGYTIRPDPADPTRGTLVHAEQAEESEPAAPSSDRSPDNGMGIG